jgi:ArsR family transcriptional regulator, arsenate/arsenite/antimonite-responsive transcriptional repressor
MCRDLKSLDCLLKALADPTRLRIVGLLQGGEVCVCHIHESLKISQPKASRHLAYLRRAGVVQADKRGLWVYYRLAPQPAVAQTLLDAARHCVAHLTTAQQDTKRLERAIGCCLPTADSLQLSCCPVETT